MQRVPGRRSRSSCCNLSVHGRCDGHLTQVQGDLDGIVVQSFGFDELSNCRTVADITENPYDPILGRKRLFEPSVVQTDDFPIHRAVEFDVRGRIYVLDPTKSSRTGVRVDVPPTLVMSDVFPFIQQPIDDTQVLTQSTPNVS